MFEQKIKKREDCEIRFVTGEHKGARFVEFREWFTPEDSDEWYPTKRGIRMNSQQFTDFMTAARAGENEILAELMLPVSVEETEAVGILA